MIRWLTAGESHGPKLTGIIEGLPSGIEFNHNQLKTALERRRKGYGRGARQKIETDQVTITGGLRHGKTTGAPIALEIANTEWEKWQAVLSADPVHPDELKHSTTGSDEKELARNQILTRPRPGHADLNGMLKYAQADARNILERASARETAMRVALGELAKAFLKQLCGIQILSHVTAIGEVTSQAQTPQPTEWELLENSPVRTTHTATAQAFKQRIDTAKKTGDTIGGQVQVVAYQVPLGLGSHIQWDRRLDAQVAAAMMSIPSAKQVSIGQAQHLESGATAHDEFALIKGQVTRRSNRAGGIEGGISNGQPIIVNIGFKPISTVPHALQSFDLATRELAPALHQRSDTCQVVPAAVIAEAMLALTLANAVIETLGEGSLEQLRERLNYWEKQQATRLAVTENL